LFCRGRCALKPLKTSTCADVQRAGNQEFETQAAHLAGQDGFESHPFNSTDDTAWSAVPRHRLHADERGAGTPGQGFVPD
jgi:hypothetical protein